MGLFYSLFLVSMNTVLKRLGSEIQVNILYELVDPGIQ